MFYSFELVYTWQTLRIVKRVTYELSFYLVASVAVALFEGQYI